MQKKSILSRIKHIKVKTRVESIDIYRLGVFNNTMFELVELRKGKNYPPHIHKNSKADLYIIFGEGKIILNGKGKNYKAGDKFYVAKKIAHGFKVKTSTLFLSIQKPPIINKKNKIDVEYK